MASYNTGDRVRINSFPTAKRHAEGEVVGILSRGDFDMVTVRLDKTWAEVMVHEKMLELLAKGKREEQRTSGLTLEQQMNVILGPSEKDPFTPEERVRLTAMKEQLREKNIVNATWSLVAAGYQRFGVDLWDENGNDHHYLVVWAKTIDEVYKWGDRFTHINQPSKLEFANIGDDDVVILAEPQEVLV